MSLSSVPSSERIHIGFFGLRNVGKSSLVNAVTGQSLSVVSDVKGTTTDPVKKAMELLPVGPVVIIDTPGIDDVGELGSLRVKKAIEVLERTDVAVLVSVAGRELCKAEKELIRIFEKKSVPYLVAFNKCDLTNCEADNDNEIAVSALSGENIFELKERISKIAKLNEKERKILSGIVNAGNTVLLVIPIDKAAPKGRLILPQQMTMREILDCGATVVACRETELKDTLLKLTKKPDLVITDSQVFGFVSEILPRDIPLTSFSILFARYKGDLAELVKGASVLKNLKSGDKVLISEGCTHHRQCNDIGTVKMPQWIKNYSGVTPEFAFTSGGEFPESLSEYSLVVHCGGCMLNEKEMNSRICKCKNSSTPVVNYGVAIAQMHGILERSLEPFPDILRIMNETK